MAKRRLNMPLRNGGVTVAKGYLLLRRPGHPRANKQGFVRRSLLVAEQNLGRPLRPGEVVHHINQIRNDDRPENIQVFPSQSAHIAHHNRAIRRGTIPDEIVAEIKRLLALPPTPRERRRGRHGVTGRPVDPTSVLQIAKRFGLHYGSVCNIRDGITYRGIGET
jgi:hypothetical protein